MGTQEIIVTLIFAAALIYLGKKLFYHPAKKTTDEGCDKCA